LFTSIIAEKDNNLIICGDWNTALNPNLDRTLYTGSPASSRDPCSAMITEFMQRYNLCDLWRFHNPTSQYYTCRQTNSASCSRIDYSLVSFSVAHGSHITHSPFPYSDHSIVSIHIPSTVPTAKRGPGVWKLNTSILQDQHLQLYTRSTL